MRFSDSVIENSNFKDPGELAYTVIHRLCGKRYKVSLSDADLKTLKQSINRLAGSSFQLEQLNELLLLLKQDRVEEGFYKFFFQHEAENGLEQLKFGITKFRGYAMLCYGNFKYAFRSLSKFPEDKIRQRLHQFLSIRILGDQRPPKTIDIEPIDKDKTSYLGYISKGKERKENEYLNRLLNVASDEEKQGIVLSLPGKDVADKSKLYESHMTFAKKLNSHYDQVRVERSKVEEVAVSNTNIYLTWDFMDVYVATSMRQPWEYEEVFEFCQKIFHKEDFDNGDPNPLVAYKLRYFDPTQCVSPNRIDKGLIEGLVLNRVLCTIYMVQESDTLGKDSELASTLAQRKPVIAFIPHINNVDEFARKVECRPLEYMYTRLKLLLAEDIEKNPDLRKTLDEYSANWKDELRAFIEEYELFRDRQPFTLATQEELEVKDKSRVFRKVSGILARMEAYNFDKRADTLQKTHPLAIQVDLETGVANGVLVTRNEKDCALLLENFLTNQVSFEIKHVRIFDVDKRDFDFLANEQPGIARKLDFDAKSRILSVVTDLTQDQLEALSSWAKKTEGAKPLLKYLVSFESHGVDILEETISKSPFRVVTNDERLTNSFWNFFLTLDSKNSNIGPQISH